MSISIEARVDGDAESGVQVFTDLDDAVAAVGTFLEEQWRRMNHG
ncbi:hypothetical protein ACO0LV_09945 [Pseudactinotalea sp. Z1739]